MPPHGTEVCTFSNETPASGDEVVLSGGRSVLCSRLSCAIDFLACCVLGFFAQVFVGGIAKSATDAEVREFCQACGEVCFNIAVIQDHV